MRKIVAIAKNDSMTEDLGLTAASVASVMKLESVVLSGDADPLIEKACSENDVALFLFAIAQNSDIQKYLDKARELRVPYVFIRPQRQFSPKRIILPITNLPEEREKIPFAVAFAKHYDAEIVVYKPNDYGSRAEQNINFATQVFDSSQLDYRIDYGRKDSYKVEYEAMVSNNSDSDSIIIISASREYGLDDILFGPKERKIIKHSSIPVVVINPRGDLYLLCD